MRLGWIKSKMSRFPFVIWELCATNIRCVITVRRADGRVKRAGI